MMMNHTLEYGRKAEEVLWRRVFYDVIQKLKQQKRVSEKIVVPTLDCRSFQGDESSKGSETLDFHPSHPDNDCLGGHVSGKRRC